MLILRAALRQSSSYARALGFWSWVMIFDYVDHTLVQVFVEVVDVPIMSIQELGSEICPWIVWKTMGGNWRRVFENSELVKQCYHIFGLQPNGCRVGFMMLVITALNHRAYS
jgi:hypothetical protein